MTKWFVKRGEAKDDDLGPLRPSELLEMVRNGDVRPESMLRKDDSAYFQASDVGGLFEAAMRPTIQYFCPQCKAEIPEPPVTCPHCDFNVTRALTRITENTIASTDEQGLTEQAGNSVRRWLRKKQAARAKQKDG